MIKNSGHSSEITCMISDDDIENILISGGQDNDIIYWDMINQSGMFR